MKDLFLRAALVTPVLSLITSGTPISSQKAIDTAKQENVFPAPSAQADSTLAVPNESLFKEAIKKAKSVDSTIEKSEKRASRLDMKVDNLVNRQAKILLYLTPVRVVDIPSPLPARALPVKATTPEIKPVEAQRAGWWERTFRHKRK